MRAPPAAVSRLEVDGHARARGPPLPRQRPADDDPRVGRELVRGCERVAVAAKLEEHLAVAEHAVAQPLAVREREVEGPGEEVREHEADGLGRRPARCERDVEDGLRCGRVRAARLPVDDDAKGAQGRRRRAGGGLARREVHEGRQRRGEVVRAAATLRWRMGAGYA